MRLKEKVSTKQLTPQTLLAIMIAQEVYRDFQAQLVITSICDGLHSSKSKHYEGNAFDCRTKHLSMTKAANIAATLQDRLGDEYDVVLESDHLHVEFDPE